MGCVINYNDAAFRALFPPYANTTTYPQANIQLLWNSASLYIANPGGGCYCGGMNVAQRTQALNLMTAHLLFLQGIAATGEVPGVITGATVDKVSISLQPPPEPNQWQWWLNQSPYGQQLLALLQVLAVGGFFVSSAPPGRAGFQWGI